MSAPISLFVSLVLATGLQVSGDAGRQLTDYLKLVEAYRDGDRESAVEAIAGWESDDLLAVQKELPNRLRPYWDGLQVFVPEEQITTLDQAREASKPTPLQWLATAMMLHTEAARRARGDTIEGQLDFARRLSDLGEQMEKAGQRVSYLLPESEVRLQFKARWHVLAGTILLGSERVARAAEHFDIALGLRPADPVVLLAAGSLHERYAARLAVQRSGPAQDDGPVGGPGRDEHLQRARDLYARSLDADPALGEARLRYARVLSFLGDHDRAAAEASRVFGFPLTPNVEYLARMVAGSVEQARGQAEEARANYLSARRLCGGCQSAMLALSAIRLDAGDRTGARTLVDAFVRRSRPDASNDPWWTYHRGQWHQVDAMLADVRQAVPR